LARNRNSGRRLTRRVTPGEVIPKRFQFIFIQGRDLQLRVNG